MKILKVIFILLVAFSSASIYSQNSGKTGNEKRLALVIGNAKYTFSGELSNPENDAKAMKTALLQVGFDVFEYENLTEPQMKAAIDDFGKRLKNYSVGLFFYAGHGIQSKGFNYLIPVDANLQTEQQIEYDCVQADRVLGLMEAAGSPVNIVILDACRNNPFERSWSRSTEGGGLAFMNAPGGSLIAYATSPGRTASDGAGSNGLYTSALLENLKKPDMNILQMFQSVRRTVSDKSFKKQIPWESTSLTSDFYFVKPTKNANTNILTSNTDIQTDINSENSNIKIGAAYSANSSENNNTKNLSGSSNITWKHNSTSFWLYYDNDAIQNRVKSEWSNDDLLVYDPVYNFTCLLKDYKKSPEDKILKVQLLGTNENILWKRSKENLFWLYVKGEQIAKRTKSVWVDDDVLVYDNESNTTYILKDYKSRDDNQLRSAIVFDNSESVFWRRQDSSYFLYVKGESIQKRTKSGWVDNNLLVYDETTNTTFMLNDYMNKPNKELQPVQIISYIDNVFWRKKEKSYYFYLKGEQVAARTTNYWKGNDLIVTDPETNTSYILLDYGTVQQNVLRPAVKYVNEAK
jgi:hypothetical protein